MVLTEVFKKPAEWIWREPVLLLPAVVQFIPALLLLIAAQQALQRVASLLTKGNVWQYLVQNIGTLLTDALPLLGLLIFASILSVLFTWFTNLAYANLVQQKRAGKKISINEAFEFAKQHWTRYVVNNLVAGILVLGVFLLLIVCAIIFAMIGRASPVLIVVLILLGLFLALVILIPLLVVIAVGFILLLPISAYSEKTGLDAVKLAVSFVWNNKWRAVIFLIALSLAGGIINQLSSAFFPYLWLMLPVSFFLGLVLNVWGSMVAAEFWLAYTADVSLEK